MSMTTVGELARSLGLPPSTVIEQCQRLGIGASWAGAELSEADANRLRAELDVPVDAAVPTGAPASSAVTGSLPPTAVGSRPDLIDEVTVAEEEPADEMPRSQPGFAGSTLGSAAEEKPNAASAPEAAPHRHLDRGTRHAAIWLAVAIVIFGVSLTVRSPWMVWSLWAAGAVALGFTLLGANRGRRQASTHPERVKGLGISVGIIVVAVAMVVGLVAALVAVVRPDPAADVPVVGELDSVSSARWGFHRVALVSGHGWKAPAKSSGTCWRPRDAEDGDEPRVDDRVEVGQVRVTCDRSHTVEVLSVFSLGTDLDAPYPGLDGIVAAAGERCTEDIATIAAAGVGTLLVEYPTEAGWDDADHDVTCAVRFAEPRRGSIAS